MHMMTELGKDCPVCLTPSSLLSNVVYKFQCLCDADQVYIGKTKRHLTVRVREHGNSRSAIFDHLQLCSRCKDNFSCNRFKILDRGRDDFETTIKEALHIKNSRPKLNKQLYTCSILGIQIWSKTN